MDNQKIASELVDMAESLVASNKIARLETIYDVSDDEQVWEDYWLDVQEIVQDLGFKPSAIRQVARKYGLLPLQVKDDVETERSESR